MNGDSFEVLSALVDGEAIRAEELAAALELPGAHSALVDFVRIRAEELAAALELPGAHSALVDFVRIREAVERDAARPSHGFDARLGRRFSKLERAEAPRGRRAVLWAAGLGLAVLIPFVAYLMQSPGVASEQPPAPEPTRVLSFEPGVDWEAQ